MEKKTVNRRGFILKTGVGLGVLLGVGVIACGPLRRTIAQKVDEGPAGYKNDYEAYIWFELQQDGSIVLHSPKVEMGQGIFTALAQIAADELEMDFKNIKVVHATTNHGPIDSLSTGGSLTVASLYQPLRELAATMREMIKVNAATIMGIPANTLTVKNGEVIGSSSKLSFAEIASKSTNWKIEIKDAVLKSSKDFTIIGKPLPRIDLMPKVKGESMYGIDSTFSNMLFGSVARPPVFGAVFKSAEAGNATNMPGVVKVVIEKGFAGVVATSRVQAEDAKKALKINWEMPTQLVQQADVDALVKVGVGKEVKIQKEGNTDILKEEGTITKEYFSPLGVHGHIEPNGAAAFYENDKVIIKMSTQVASITRDEVAKALKLDKENVDIQSQYLGGGFGRRLQTPHAIEAALMSKAVGKPVHVFFERSEEFQNGVLRPPTHNVLKAKLDANGTIEAIEHHTASADVAFNSAILANVFKPLSSSLAESIVGADFGAWRGGMIHYKNIKNYSTTAYHKELPFQTSWWRGLGLLANTFAIESFMDELAHQSKQDPLAFRLKHLADDERGRSIKNVLKAACEKAGWGKPLPAGRAMGLACSIDVNTPVAQVAEVEIKNGQIKVRKVTCAIDLGIIINPDGVKAQSEGAIIMGLSATLFEEIIIKDGMATPNAFGYYPIAYMRDAPEIEVVILSSGDKPRGVGEPPIGPIGAAIANAVFNLTGKRLNRIPLQMPVS
jgi:isoquinoline 1-oxidoreductase subunit beta